MTNSGSLLNVDDEREAEVTEIKLNEGSVKFLF